MKSGTYAHTGVIFTMIKNIISFNRCSMRTVSVKIDFDAEYFRAKIFIENIEILAKHTRHKGNVLTDVDKITIAIDNFVQFVHFENECEQTERDYSYQRARISGLCVIGKCFSIINNKCGCAADG